MLPPALAATLATTFEIGCSSLLIAGLATRLATLPLLAKILTIQLFVYPQAWHEHLVWGAILLFVLTRGAGAVSRDHLVGRLAERTPELTQGACLVQQGSPAAPRVIP